MPFMDFPFRLKPVGQFVPWFTTALVPQFVRPLSDLLFQADIFVHSENWSGGFGICCFLHKGDGRSLLWWGRQKAKQSQPRPKNPPYRLRTPSMPARS